MTIGDRFGDTAEQAVDKLGGADQAKDRLGQAAEKANSATGGQFEDAIHKGEEGARSAVDKVSKKNKKKR
jgi:hypothetical protein